MTLSKDELARVNDAYADIYGEVYQQLERQIEMWGLQDHPDGTENSAINRLSRDSVQQLCELQRAVGDLPWSVILLEETQEAYAEDPGTDALRNELIQVAAVAIAWIENLDRRRANG